MTPKKNDAGPRPSRKKPTGGLGPQWVWVSGSRPPPGSGSARITRNYPSARVRVRVRPDYLELPGPGPRRDMGWVKYSKLKAKKDLSIPTRPP